MKTILAGNLAEILVDDEDFDFLNQWRWRISPLGCAIRWQRCGSVNGKRARIIVFMHRLIMKAKKGEILDHKDMNKLNNQKSNLRFCNRGENRMNCLANIGGQSKYRGVSKNKGCKSWRAQIQIKNKKIYLGSFESEYDAAKAFDDAAKSYYGEFAKLNNEVFK